MKYLEALWGMSENGGFRGIFCRKLAFFCNFLKKKFLSNVLVQVLHFFILQNLGCVLHKNIHLLCVEIFWGSMGVPSKLCIFCHFFIKIWNDLWPFWACSVDCSSSYDLFYSFFNSYGILTFRKCIHVWGFLINNIWEKCFNVNLFPS